MRQLSQKLGFSVPVTRLFTRPDSDAYSLIHFRTASMPVGIEGSEIEFPDNWGTLAREAFFETAAAAFHAGKSTLIEENTVPSWLWRRSASQGSLIREHTVQQVFTRSVGSATYEGWKLGMFADEANARAFYDELRYALAQRFIAVDLKILARMGHRWAFGGVVATEVDAKSASPASIEISNAVIDAVVSGRRDKNMRLSWQRMLRGKGDNADEGFEKSIVFADVQSEWGSPEKVPLNATIDVMSCRHNDGSINIEALKQLSRLLVLFLDLHDVGDEKISIGLANVAPLLVALSLAYNSDEARATVASICAIVTASAYAASAEQAALRGASRTFSANRESILRTLRNQWRSTYGERNDYEKISVVPVSLSLEASTDLSLAAAARRSWDDAVHLVQNYGVRYDQVTSLAPSQDLSQFLESVSDGIEPLQSLVRTIEGDEEVFQEIVHPAVSEGLTRLGLPREQITSIYNRILGVRSLAKAPEINSATLKAKGFSAKELKKIDDYLSASKNIRFVFTPWILGEDFCRQILKIKVKDLTSPRFNLLRHIGFSTRQIAAANGYCYGTGNLAGAPELTLKQQALFATARQVTAEARIQMAASIQSFVSSDAGLFLVAGPETSPEHVESLVLQSWRQGIRSLTLAYRPDENLVASRKPSVATALTLRKTAKKNTATRFNNAKAPALPTRRSKSRASGTGRASATPTSKGSRRNWSR